MADRPTIAILPPEEAGHEDFHEQQQQQQQSVDNSNKSVATLSSPWAFDDLETACSSCKAEFNPFNRRHHCRLCGKIFCNDCSNQRSMIPPSSIVLAPKTGKKTTSQQAAQTMFYAQAAGASSQDDDPDRMLTYLRRSSADANEILYGRGLEERFTLARQPLRVCRGCFQKLAPLQEDLRASNSNAMRFNMIDPASPARLFNSPVARTLGHEIRKAAYTLNNLLPQPKRLGAVVGVPSASRFEGAGGTSSASSCQDTCRGLSPTLADVDGVRIPTHLLERAKGVAFLTVVKGGFGLAGLEFGSGLVVARLHDHSWSAPSAIGCAGASWGALLGAQISDHVFFLMTDQAVQMMFRQEGSVQLGADVGVAVGPVGRALEGNLGLGNAVAPIYTYSMSKGFYAGVSLDGKVIVTRNGVNEKFYGRTVSGPEILAGGVPLPPAASPLYEALARCHVYATQSSASHSRPGAPALARPALLGAIDEHRQQQEDYEYGEFMVPPTPLAPSGPALSAPPPTTPYDHQSVMSGMSDITLDPGY